MAGEVDDVPQQPDEIPRNEESNLSSLSEVRIRQKFNVCEVLRGADKNKKYKIYDSQGQQIMKAVEDSNCCTKKWFGPARPFTMNITDNNKKPIMTFSRPLRCLALPFWSCCLQEMKIESPPGTSIGGIRQLWTPWKPKFEVHDSQQQPLFHILGECCFTLPCVDIHFKIVDAETGSDVAAELIKHWNGFRELFGGTTKFSVLFPMDLDVIKKTLLIGATILIDYNYYALPRIPNPMKVLNFCDTMSEGMGLISDE